MQRGNEHHPRLSHLLSPLKHHGVEYRGLQRVARPIAGGNWAAPTIPTVPHPNGGI